MTHGEEVSAMTGKRILAALLATVTLAAAAPVAANAAHRNPPPCGDCA
jgi:hypothetical protein